MEAAHSQDTGPISVRDSAMLHSDGSAGSVEKGAGSAPSQEGGGSAFHTSSQDVGMGPCDSPEEDIEIDDFEDDMIW